MQHTIELSARMAMNASLVPDGAKVADVGCDMVMFPFILL